MRFLLHSEEFSRVHFGDQKVDGFGFGSFLDLHWVWSSCRLKIWRRCWFPHIHRLTYHNSGQQLWQLQLVWYSGGKFLMDRLHCLQKHKPAVSINWVYFLDNHYKCTFQVCTYLNASKWSTILIGHCWNHNHIGYHHKKKVDGCLFEENCPNWIGPKSDTNISCNWHETGDCVT